ncbi:GntR family transcriptional regulator [Roseibium sp.]|uniref:GntR family transcriptional regulator n=1 Tax=Roseibium sp. TaxID=1936156 RepID=UPI003BACE424
MSTEHIADSLQADIIAGRFRPGAELKQGEIAERFQVSRIPIRDALQLLAARGLIDLVPNRRARVISLTRDEIREIYDIRVLLECNCLAAAIGQIKDTDLERISAAFHHSSIDAETANWADGDWAFHKALYWPSGKARQIGMIDQLRQTCRIHISGYGILPGQTAQWLKDHQDIVDACHTRDSERATRVLKLHIEAAGKTLMDAIP